MLYTEVPEQCFAVSRVPGPTLDGRSNKRKKWRQKEKRGRDGESTREREREEKKKKKINFDKSFIFTLILIVYLGFTTYSFMGYFLPHNISSVKQY